jgi:N-formylmaleamate deformylase
VSAGWQEGDVTIDDATIHYYRRGSGPQVVLAHGALDDGRCWTRVAEALESDYELIAYDARFHGKSSAPGSGMRRGADDLVDLIEALTIEHPYAIGHSMGAGTVAAAVRARPELIRAAVLEDPGWPETAPDPESAGAFMKAFADSLSAKSVEELVTICAKMNPTWDPAEFVPWAESKAAFRGSDVISGTGGGLDDWETLCSALRCPVLLVCGGNEARNRIVPPSVAARAGSCVPRSSQYAWSPLATTCGARPTTSTSARSKRSFAGIRSETVECALRDHVGRRVDADGDRIGGNFERGEL